MPSPPPSPEPTSTPEDIVRRVLLRLFSHHPNLRRPSLSDRSKFLEKAENLPDLPEWMWYGMLHYAVSLEETEEVIDFGILDELLVDGEDYLTEPRRLWNMTFYYMYLHLEGRNSSSAANSKSESEKTDMSTETGQITPPATEYGESATEEGEVEEVKDVQRVQATKEAEKVKVAEVRTVDSKQRPQSREGGDLDWRTVVIFLLLGVIALLVAFPYSAPLEFVRWKCAGTYAQAAAAVSRPYNELCQAQCQKAVGILVDNIKYRLGVLELPGVSTGTLGRVTSKTEL